MASLCCAEEDTEQAKPNPRLIDPVTVAEFAELGEAALAKGLLESGGIPCVLSDMNDRVQNLNSYIKHTAGAVGYTTINIFNNGFELLVDRQHADAAIEALEQLASENTEINEGED